MGVSLLISFSELNLFDLLNPRKNLDCDEYLESIRNPIKQDMTRDLIECASQIFSQINRRYRVSFQIPIIKIKNESNISAEGMDGIIYISEGLIDYCMSMKHAFQIDIIGENKLLEESQEINFISKMVLTWIFSHEFFHIIRMHNRVLEQVENTTAILNAIEHDADLCAIAEVYRLLQNKYSLISCDLELRRLTLYSVFWGIRSLPNENQHSTHLALEERMLHMHGKICMVSELDGSGVYPDVNCERPETKARIEPLIKVILFCEEFYSDYFNVPPLVDKWKELLNGHKHLTVVDSWETIRKNVLKESKTPA